MELKLNDYLTAKEDPEEVFQILEKLGQGTYGSVYKVLHKNTGKIVAAKILYIDKEIESFKKEIQIMKECNSPYILRYYGSYVKNNQIWIVVEYCDAGSIHDLMRITKRKINEEQIASIIQMVLKGLIFLHEKKMIHRDIKAGNILLNHDGYAKLADFGVSAQLLDSLAKKTSRMGTPYWMSPEIITKNDYNQLTDIWSLGITCIELAEGDPPYADIKPLRAMMLIVNNPPKGLSQPNSWSEDFNDFVRRCLTLNPDKRPSAKELLTHPFITSKSRGPLLISELVAISLEEISHYRKETTEEEETIEDDPDLEKGTVIENFNAATTNTMVVNQPERTTQLDSLIYPDKETKGKEDKPLFMQYMDMIELTYDENKIQSDLLQNINHRNEEGIREELEALNFIDNYTSEIKSESEDIEKTIKKNSYNKNEFLINKCLLNREDSTSDTKSLNITSNIYKSIDMDNIHNRNICDIQQMLSDLYIERDEQINLIKLKYQKKISKLKEVLKSFHKGSGHDTKFSSNIWSGNKNKIVSTSSVTRYADSLCQGSMNNLNSIKVTNYHHNDVNILNAKDTRKYFHK